MPRLPTQLNKIIHGTAEKVLPTLQENTFQTIYIDPPFNTGKTRLNKCKINGTIKDVSFEDNTSNYTQQLAPKIVEAKRVLKETGTFYLHVDQHESHYCTATLDDAHLVLGMVIEAIGADTFNRIVTAAAEKRTTP